MWIHHSFSNYDPELALPYFMPRSDLVTWAFVQEKLKLVFYLEPIGAYDFKVGRFIELNDLMKLHKY